MLSATKRHVGLWLSAGSRVLAALRSEEHTSELQSRLHLVCRLLLEKKKKNDIIHTNLQIHNIGSNLLLSRQNTHIRVTTTVRHVGTQYYASIMRCMSLSDCIKTITL